MAIISFNITVTDLDAVLALYDRIQVWRAAEVDGEYEELTAEDNEAAASNGAIAGPWDVGGLTLTIQQGGGTVHVVPFTGPSPIGLARVIDQINDVLQVADELPVNSGKVRLRSIQTGTGASLVVGGSAAVVLGLEEVIKSNGKIHRIVLTDPTVTYRFRDFDGEVTNWYKTRFFSSISGVASTFSTSRQGAAQVLLPAPHTSIAILNLVDGTGRPIVGRRVIFVPVSSQVVEYNSLKYGILPGVDRIFTTTNDQGHAELSLVRGARFRVFVEGVQFQREILVPNTDEFDLLTAIASAHDHFTIVQAPPMPIRNS